MRYPNPVCSEVLLLTIAVSNEHFAPDSDVESLPKPKKPKVSSLPAGYNISGTRK